jgi:hypothetical protein
LATNAAIGSFAAEEGSYMRWSSLLILTLLLVTNCAVTAVAKASGTGASTSLNSLEQVQVDHEDQLRQLGSQYLTALKGLRSRVQATGNLDHTKLVIAEADRFTAKGTIGPADINPNFMLLRELQLNHLRSTRTLAVNTARREIEIAQRLEVELAARQAALTKQGQIEEATQVKGDRERVAKTLATAQAVVGQEAVSPALMPLPLLRPLTLSSQTRGFTGLSSNNNTYKFHVEKPRLKATLRFWATGDIGTESYGEVKLKGPTAAEKVIYRWKPKDFRKPASAITSPEQLAPIVCDVSSHVVAAGEYQVTFQWTSGPIALTIFKVELELQ